MLSLVSLIIPTRSLLSLTRLCTGGGSGIGLMATQAFAVNGAKVYIIGRTKEKLDKVAEIYGKDVPGQIIPLQGDISKKESIAAMVKEIESKEKCVCILVNKSVHNCLLINRTY